MNLHALEESLDNLEDCTNERFKNGPDSQLRPSSDNCLPSRQRHSARLVQGLLTHSSSHWRASQLVPLAPTICKHNVLKLYTLRSSPMFRWWRWSNWHERVFTINPTVKASSEQIPTLERSQLWCAVGPIYTTETSSYSLFFFERFTIYPVRFRRAITANSATHTTILNGDCCAKTILKWHNVNRNRPIIRKMQYQRVTRFLRNTQRICELPCNYAFFV